MKFRIKIDERYNGEKIYQPQVRKFLFFGWKNIITYGTNYFSSSVMSSTWLNEEAALKVIENYKNYLIEAELKEIKSTKYKLL